MMQEGSAGLHVVHAGSTVPHMARVTAQGEVSGSHVVLVEARAVASEPSEKLVGATKVEGEPNQTQEES
jgi:hypothetical protein